MDRIAVAGLITGIVAGVAGIVGAIAAIKAAIYAKASATEAGLRRVQENTANTAQEIAAVHTHIASLNERLDNQHRHDTAVSKAQRVPIRVWADGDRNAPLDVELTVFEHGVPLLSIEMFNQVGTRYGSAVCTRSNDSLFRSQIPPNEAQRWYSGGNSDQMANRKLLTIRAHMVIDGFQVYRNFPVNLTMTRRPGQDTTRPQIDSLILEGSC